MDRDFGNLESDDDHDDDEVFEVENETSSNNERWSLRVVVELVRRAYTDDQSLYFANNPRSNEESIKYMVA